MPQSPGLHRPIIMTMAISPATPKTASAASTKLINYIRNIKSLRITAEGLFASPRVTCVVYPSPVSVPLTDRKLLGLSLFGSNDLPRNGREDSMAPLNG